MSEPFAGADSEPTQAPRQIIEAILEQGRAAGKGLSAFVEAIAFARRHVWRDIEADLYVRLGLALARRKDAIGDEAAEALAEEARDASLTDEVHVVLRALLAAMGRARAGLGLLRLATAFESKTDDPTAAWQARLMVGGFLDGLRRADPALAEQTHRRVTQRLADWVIDYHLTEAAPDLELRSHATFNALLAGRWSEAAADNAAAGLDGAFHCAIERLTRAADAAWFSAFLDGELTPRVAALDMHRRLTRETLYRIGEMLAAARRRVYRANTASAIALTTLEEAVHRPHRLQLDAAGGMKLELELPGPRGFQPRAGGTRLRVFDISRDGCLAVTEGPARFEQTAAAEAQLRRAGGRIFNVHRLSGTLRQGSAEWNVGPETALVLHDASRRSEWAAIDGASVVRVMPDRATDRLWVGFHFDRVVPAVQQEIETLVYGAA